VPDRRTKSLSRETLDIDTTNILFIAAGAFNGLEKIVKKRKNVKVAGHWVYDISVLIQLNIVMLKWSGPGKILWHWIDRNGYFGEPKYQF